MCFAILLCCVAALQLIWATKISCFLDFLAGKDALLLLGMRNALTAVQLHRMHRHAQARYNSTSSHWCCIDGVQCICIHYPRTAQCLLCIIHFGSCCNYFCRWISQFPHIRLLSLRFSDSPRPAI
ncbi:hypothetical protein HYPSUDRAFT_783748 [Hypholoma sublateritium FD-334 SS-4]|uniref:Secreted protein n=1 Tax=Hypholoma sublateritium (strain FD-334 SS-4) TaxID=945553 RepID=A0A0D2NVX7_HYPSF|nr:hypothetical protein HYPSUDRAFT_783748 [Hypholoma sublateritium FD-334 SS-4]